MTNAPGMSADPDLGRIPAHEALAYLRFHHAPAFEISFEIAGKDGEWTARDTRTGSLITAGGPQELRRRLWGLDTGDLPPAGDQRMST